MLLNIIAGFVIPWLFGLIIYRKNKRIILFIAPISAVIAFTTIALEEYMGFWNLYPFDIYDPITALPYCLGLYTVNPSILIYFINDRRFNPYFNIVLITILTTIEEGLGVLVGRVTYDNGWNMGWTFISYLIPYIIIYLFYKYLKKEGLL